LRLRRTTTCAIGLALVLAAAGKAANAPAIPLPEHPRPDFERAEWLNLNGSWQFRFDKDNAGLAGGWAASQEAFPLKITVPFPWGSALSGVGNEADIGWYSRQIRVPAEWRGKRVFLVVGASDWLTRGWLDGQSIGEHRGGYTPFEWDLTPVVKWGEDQRLVLRVDDTPHAFKLEGKQGYGPAKGIWQTLYLEARPEAHLASLHFRPDVDGAKVIVKAEFNQPLAGEGKLQLRARDQAFADITVPVPDGAGEFEFALPIPRPRLWSLEDPFLYEVDAVLAAGGAQDRVSTYFGMRKISVIDLPGTDFPYIALNDRPVYLQMTLDQAYHPEGFYTYPSDEFMRDEILRSRRIGLNANRLHVKIDVPRKLYWADRLGLLLMCDVPNSWGEPDAEMRREIEHALRGMIQRDFNHPSIFSWVPFNETWGLFTKQGDKRVYLPETQEWVASVYRLAKALDPTRLVEDNSPCNYDHVETDINSWHAYLPGYAWRESLAQVTRDTYPGSVWNFIGGRKQARQPLLNSECGNVWGYEGSTGDVDWSWDYHIMMNEFRRHPKICGWLYTEHHDVINEWNGYYRYDRSEKITGLEDLVRGMSLNDLHGPFYISIGSDLCRDVKPGEVVEVPLWASFMADHAPGQALQINVQTFGWDNLGQNWTLGNEVRPVPFRPWMSEALAPLKLNMPGADGLLIVALRLETATGLPLHRNFTTFRVTNGPAPRDEIRQVQSASVRVVRFAPQTFSAAQWSLKQWNILDGLKANGAGHGFFEYRVAWPAGLSPAKVGGVSLLLEASAKQLLGKDREGSGQQDGDYMRGKGTLDPSLNPNAYPMTDMVRFPSAVRMRVNGVAAGLFDLPDDPADHRGILSWHAQLRDRKLREAGSYGYLIRADLPASSVRAAAESREFVIRLEVDAGLPGGLAIYGERFGRYPVDPSLVFELK
jgi:hypothetical protein